MQDTAHLAFGGFAGRFVTNQIDSPNISCPMTAEQMTQKDVLRTKLEVLRSEHQDLDIAIRSLQDRAITDEFAIKRLKKRKLALKDQMTRIKDSLIPDIIA
jgi:hypothetical protein